MTLPVSLVIGESGDDFEADFDAEEDAVVSRRLAKGKDWLEHLTGALQGRIHGFNVSAAHVWADH